MSARATATVYQPNGDTLHVHDDTGRFSWQALAALVRHPAQVSSDSRIETLPNVDNFRLKWLENGQEVPQDLVAYVNDEGRYYWSETNGQIGYAQKRFEHFDPVGPVVLVEAKYLK